MSNYTKIVDYAAKDALNTGDPVKLVKGTELGAEYDAIATAIATKANSASPAFTGVSGFAVGAVGAPSIYMTGYATTGWYNIGANNWGFAVSGAKVLDIASTGLSVSAVLATFTLSATGASNPLMYLTTTRAFGVNRNWQIGVDQYAEGHWTLTPSTAQGGSTYTTPLIDVSSTGLAVTGTLSSTGILSALNTGATTTTAILTTGVSDPSFRLEAVNGAAGGGAGAEQAKFGVTYAGAFDTGLQFLRGSGTQNGTLNLLAGTAVVASASSVGLAVTGDVSSTGDYKIAGTGIYNAIATNTSLGLFADTNAYAGIKVYGSSHATKANVTELLAGTGVVVGTVSSTGLAVTGTLSATGTSSLARIDQSNGSINFASLGNGSTSWQIGTQTAGKPLDIFIGGVVRAQFSDNGLAVSGTTSTTTGMAVGGATAGAGGIAFPATAVAVADVNTLDDYEEGTWTPALKFGGNSTGMTYTTQAATYTKIGNRAYVDFTITLSAKGSSTGSVTITGLPFTIGATTCGSILIGGVTYSGIVEMLGSSGGTSVAIQQTTEAGSRTDLAETNFTDTSVLVGSISFKV